MAKQAFDGTRFTGWWLPPEELVIIGLDTDDGKEHPLHDLKIRIPLTEEFIQNVDEHGIFTPIKVRKNGDLAEVVFGRNRVRAAREVNKRRRKRGDPELRVPCTKVEAEDKRLMAISFAENAARRAPDPIDEARDMQRLASQGYDEGEVAVHFACSKQKVRKRLALLCLATPVINAVRSGQIAASSALTLKTLSHEDQTAKLAELKTAAPPSDTNGKTRRPTGQQIKAAAGRQVRPGVKQIKKMIEEGSLKDTSAESLLRWWTGEWPASKVKGLTAALKAANILPKE